MLYKTITVNHYENGKKTGTGTYKRVNKEKASAYYKDGFTVWILLKSGAYECKPYTIGDPSGDLQKTLDGLKHWGTLKSAEYYAIADAEKVSQPYYIN